MVKNLGPFCVSILMGVLCPNVNAEGRVIIETISHDGLERSYKLYLPESYNGSEAWPLVISIHGKWSNASEQMEVTRMNEVADANKFIVVYPQALGDPAAWHDDDLNGGGGNDIDFLATMLTAMENNYSIAASQVYVTGLSQGGAMSYALATELSDRIAAMASVSGRNIFNPVPARPLPLLLMQGTADPIAPPEGGKSPETGFIVPPVRDIVDAWRGINRCQTTPIPTVIPDTNLDDESSVTRFDDPSCANYVATSGETIASEVVYYEIENGGHAWPGGTDHGFGPLNRDINASEVIWEFFRRHQLPLSPQGDFNGDGVLDVNDIDLLGQEIYRTSQRRVFDIDRDQLVTTNDFTTWATDLRHTWIGDTDLDGEFNSRDMIQVFLVGLYESQQPASWASGDWDGSGFADSRDFIAAFLDGGYEQGPRPAMAVPEPSTLGLLLVGGLLLVSGRRNRARGGQR